MNQIPNIEETHNTREVEEKKEKCSICRDADGKWKEGRNTTGINKHLICKACQKDGWKIATSKNILDDKQLSKVVNHKI